MTPPVTSISQQLFWLFILAVPIATIARTVVFEEVFREFREYCQDRNKTCGRLWQRKFFYLFTCEYCFSHWVTVLFLILTRFHLLLADWRGYVIAFFSLPLVANAYLNLYARLRVEITKEKAVTKQIEQEVHGATDKPAPPRDADHARRSSEAA